MKILSGEQAARLDRLSIRKRGIPAARLMERASLACVETLHAKLDSKKSRIVIVAGPGNNGGDGLAMAEPLARLGHSVEVFCYGSFEKYSPEARAYYERARPFLQSPRRFLASLKKAAAVVDALFGIGLRRSLAGRFASALRAMNRASGFKLAVDIPSGISADTGQVLGLAFRADCTVTFETPKRGQLLPPAWDYVGDLKVASIGLSRGELRAMKSEAEWIDESLVSPWIRPRPRGAHKGKGGRVWVLAGSRNMPGAGYLCARSALRSGAGLVTWALPEAAFGKLDLRYAEVMLAPLRNFSELIPKLSRAQALALGPGWGKSRDAAAFLEDLLASRRPPTVFDADALNLLAERKQPLKFRRGDILTPHWREMSRLTGLSVREIEAAPWRIARDFARRRGCTLVLKGYRSLVATSSGRLYVNSSGGPNLATAGSGDVLTGLIAGLLGQGLSPERAAVVAVFIHGRAGDLLSKEKGDRGSLASDLVELWPKLLKDLLSHPPLKKGGRGDLTQAPCSKGGPILCDDL